MVAAAGLLSIIGTLMAYGGYSFISSMTKNYSSTLNKTRANLVNTDIVNNVLNITLPMNTSQISEETENIIKQIEIINDSKDLNQTEELVQNTIHEGLELAESVFPSTNEIDEFKENSNIYPEVAMGRGLEYGESSNWLGTNNNNENDLEKAEKEKLNFKEMFDFEPFPSNNHENKQNIDKIPENPLYGTNHHETIGAKFKNPVENPLYPIHDENENHFQDNILHLNEFDEESYKEKINPKLSLKFNTNFDPHLENKEEESIKNNEIDSMVNDNLEMNNTMEANNLENVDYNKVENLESEVIYPVIGDLIDSLVSVKEDSENLKDEIIPMKDEIIPMKDEIIPMEDEIIPMEDEIIPMEDEIIPMEDEIISIADEIISMEDEIISDKVKNTFIDNTENTSMDENAKTLLITYAEIAGIVVGAVLIVTCLIFLSIRQALKHRRRNKIQKRYAVNEVDQVRTYF